MIPDCIRGLSGIQSVNVLAGHKESNQTKDQDPIKILENLMLICSLLLLEFQ